MIFVPLPLFATIFLCCILVFMIRTRDMTARANQLFALLVGLYSLQSLMLCLRWGYRVDAVAVWIGLLAPVLPILAYFAYLSLRAKLTSSMLWPIGIVVLNWALVLLLPDFADPAIMMTYLVFGAIIVRNSFGDASNLGLVRIEQAEGAVRAMRVTGIALMCSALADLYATIDFITTGGQNIGWVVSLLQTGFLLAVGLVSMMGQTSQSDDNQNEFETVDPVAATEDKLVMERLNRLFDTDAMHLDTELNLRRLSRRLSLPDRSVSQAINRTQNMSVSQYVNSFRIRDACKMLQTTDQSVLQISLAAGFLTKSNFNREFARVTGKTPSQWRH